MVNTRSKNGELTEQLFILRALERDLCVSKPISYGTSFDFTVTLEDRTVAIQVKRAYSTHKDSKANWETADLRSTSARKGNSKPLPDCVDYLAVYSPSYDDFFIVPRQILGDIRTFNLQSEGKFFKYKGNWDFLDLSA